jgi:hypothetical protein
MEKRKAFVSLAVFLMLGLGIYGAPARAAVPSFTISATNVTMSSSGSNGTGSSTVTLTSVNGYAGTVIVNCEPTSAPAGAKLPYCGGSTTPVGYTMNPSGVVTGSLPLFNVPVPRPLSRSIRPAHAGPAGLALAGVVLLGLGFRRRFSRWILLGLFTVGAIAGLGAIGGCGGSNSVVTSGTYTYTVTATDTNKLAASTTIEVTVP